MTTADVVGPALSALALYLLVTALAERTSPRGRWALIGLTLVFTGRYMLWRVAELVAAEPAPTLFALAVFALEAALFAEGMLTLLIAARRADRSAEADRAERWVAGVDAVDLPTVDVFIPTYDEGPEVLERTIAAATALDYPSFTVFVLDDGRRDWVGALARRHGAVHRTRPDNAHAKAGNINAALAHTAGDLILVLDADFCALPGLLRRTVGLFRQDPRIAIVQLPQAFFNPDPIQHNLGLTRVWPDDQRLFFEEIMPVRDAWDLAFCCGTNALYRRDRLEAIGGVPTASVTEDILTTLVQRRRGWITRYLGEPLALGLCPESVTALLVQRRRWCRGNVQLLFCRDGPLGPGPLSLWTRLQFLPLYWLVALPGRALLAGLPALCLWTGLAPYPGATGATLAAFLLPALGLTLATTMRLLPGAYVRLLSDSYQLYMGAKLIPTVLSTLIKPFGAPFRVTPKGHAAVGNGDRPAAVAVVVAIAVSLGAVLLQLDPAAATFDERALANVAVFWVVFNVVALLVVLLLVTETPRRRGEERFLVDMPAAVTVFGETVAGRIVDLSRDGARLVARGVRPALGAELRLTVEDPVPAVLVGVVRHRHGRTIGVRFVAEDAAASAWLERRAPARAGRDQSRHRRRIGVRVPARVAVAARRIAVRTADLSLTGGELAWPATSPAPVGREVAVDLAGVGKVTGRLVRPTRHGCGVVFDALPPRARNGLVHLIFSDRPEPALARSGSLPGVARALGRALWGRA